MPEPFLILQLSDPHIGADWGGGNPAGALAAAVRSVGGLDTAPRAVVVSGDLAENAADDEYTQVRELLESLGMPIHVLPGNHDDRAGMRRAFGLPGSGDEPIQYAVDLGPMRLVMLDTTRPGSDDGELDGARLGWLDEELTQQPAAPTLVAMHHPPLVTGIPVMDEMGLPDPDRRALAEVLRRHPQVRRLVGGHMHRTIVGELAGRAVLSAPSIYMQAVDFASPRFETIAEPPGFAIHLLTGSSIVSHVQPVFLTASGSARVG